MKTLRQNRVKASDPDSFTEDRQLWNGIRDGKAQMLDRLFRKYYVDLFHYARSMINQPDVAEDQVQEIFVSLWSRRTSLSRVQSVRAYLFVSLRNHLLNTLKRQKIYASQEPDENLADDKDTPEQEILQREASNAQEQIVRAAMQQIPDRMREALYLKVFSGLSYKEIAPVMGVSSQVARNYVSEAYRRLYKIVSDHPRFKSLNVFFLLWGITFS